MRFQLPLLFLYDCLRAIFGRRRVIALEHLVVTPPRTSEQIAQAIRSGRVAEMNKQDAAG